MDLLAKNPKIELMGLKVLYKWSILFKSHY